MDGFGYRGHEIVSGKSYGLGPDSGRASRSDLKPWSFGCDNPEAKRKKRIYKYKVYTVEGKVKASLKKSLRWIKTKCSEIVRGY